MVIFHNYVSLPEGTSDDCWIIPENSLRKNAPVSIFPIFLSPVP